MTPSGAYPAGPSEYGLQASVPASNNVDLSVLLAMLGNMRGERY